MVLKEAAPKREEIEMQQNGRIAVIGAGPGGLAAARWLKAEGFDPVLVESHSGIGGQWDGTNPRSGIWPQMRTNTAKITTSFSDLDLPESTALFPRNQEMLAYFRAYAQRFRLADSARFNTRVTRIEVADGGYTVTMDAPEGPLSEVFSRVVVATGRYNKPSIPKVEGLDGFTGEQGVRHAFFYKNPEEFRGRRVLVAGGSISALEIASDLSMLGAAAVHLSQRRQRYVLPKMVCGVPLEYYAFSRAGALMRDTATPAQLLAAQKQFVTTYGGDPARYGAPAPHPDIAKAGFTGSQHYLNLVAENRLDVHPWMKKVEGRTVTFTDGSQVEVDAIIIGTGFDLDLDFLSPAMVATLRKDDKGMQLAEFTFHPDLPGLAFIGMWPQQGPYPVVLEQQARYVAYSWSGAIEPPSRDELARGIAACLGEGHFDDYRDQNEMALRFARLCGTDPAHVGDAAFQAMLEASATTAIMFRICGPDAREDAMDVFRAQFARYGPAITLPDPAAARVVA